MRKRLIALSRFANVRTLIREKAGNSLVEVALILAFFAAPLLVGTSEMGQLVYDSIQIQNAAHSGAEYAMQSVTLASDTPGIISATQADAPNFGTSLTVTPTVFFVCSAAIGGTQYTGSNASANATTACAGGSNHPLEFVQVRTSASVTPTLHCPGFGTTFAIIGNSAMEVEQ